MTEYNEVVTAFINTGGKPEFPNGCANCGKPVGVPIVPFDSPVGTAPHAYIQTSADNFCSVECRRDHYLARGCQSCRERKPSGIGDPGWRFGTFVSYADAGVTCPRCITEWPKYEEYLRTIETLNTVLEGKVNEEYIRQRGLLPEHVEIDNEDGTPVFAVDYDDGVYLTLEELRALLVRMGDLDVAAYLKVRDESEARIVALRQQIRKPVFYRRWLEGER